MARGIVQQDVDVAADAVLFGGEQPTVERIRLKMGRGSPNTVGPLLKDWFRRLPSRIQNPPAALPAIAAPDVPLPVLNSAKLIWDTALKGARSEAEASIAAERERLAATTADLQRKEAALDASRAAMEEAARLAQSQIEDLRRQAAELAMRLQQAEGRETGLQESLHRQQEALREERERSAAAASEHAAQRANDAERAAANERRHLQEIDRARTETARAQGELQHAHAETRAAIQKLEAAREAAEKRQGELTGELAERQRQIADRDRACTEKDRELAHLSSELAHARESGAAQQRLAAAHEEQARSVGQALAGALRTQEDLRRQLTEANEQLAVRRQHADPAAAAQRILEGVEAHKKQPGTMSKTALRGLILEELLPS